MDWGWLISFFIYQSNRTFERTKPRMTIYESNGFFFEFLGWRGSRGDEPVVSHEELGASDHSSVEYGMYCLIGSCPLLGLCPRFDVLFSHNFYLNCVNLRMPFSTTFTFKLCLVKFLFQFYLHWFIVSLKYAVYIVDTILRIWCYHA